MRRPTLHSRRDFLKLGAAAAVGSVASLTIGRPTRAQTSSGYRALVCVYLAGGNNGFNMVVPTGTTGYATYRNSRTNLALPQASLLPLDGTASDGGTYGLHPSMPELQQLFGTRNLAILGNVGTLVQPTLLADAKAASAPLPLQLFSHLDQQTTWMTSIANRSDRTGWAGRIADLYTSQGVSARLAFNISVGGSNYWQEGATTGPYALGTSGASAFDIDNTGYRNGARAKVAQALSAQAATDSNLMVQQFAAIEQSARSKVTLVNSAVSNSDFASTFPQYSGDSNLGAQLREVARVIEGQAALGDTRQIFYVQMGGFDTHNGELPTQANLLRILSLNLKAFWDALGQLGRQDAVTLFTASEFGRSLGSNGDGSDHAWGNHHLILGGAVNGGYYGTMPDLTVGGLDDIGAGRILPSTSTDQYAATLTRWFGVDDPGLDRVLPNLRNFGVRDLGFLRT